MRNIFQQITHVAIRYDDERLFTLPSPYRHHHIIEMMVKICEIEPPIRHEQGFVTDEGQFLNREEAAELVKVNGQLRKKLIAPPKLYSEDLW